MVPCPVLVPFSVVVVPFPVLGLLVAVPFLVVVVVPLPVLGVLMVELVGLVRPRLRH